MARDALDRFAEARSKGEEAITRPVRETLIDLATDGHTVIGSGHDVACPECGLARNLDHAVLEYRRAEKRGLPHDE